MGGSQGKRSVVIENNAQRPVNLSEDALRRLALQSQGQPETASPELIEDAIQKIDKEYRRMMLEKGEMDLMVKKNEFNKALTEVESKFTKHAGSPVCEDLQQKALKCYQDHYKEPLKCSEDVRAFSEAVERARRNALFAMKQQA